MALATKVDIPLNLETKLLSYTFYLVSLTFLLIAFYLYPFSVDDWAIKKKLENFPCYDKPFIYIYIYMYV